MKRSVFTLLLHDPIVDRTGREVVTAVTNLDIHDIARSSKTYGCDRYFIVNPQAEQQRIVENIIDHWKQEVSKIYHPARSKALDLVRFTRTFREAYNEALMMAAETAKANGSEKIPEKIFVVMPDARPLPDSWSYEDLKSRMENGKLCEQDDGSMPVMIVFGTGWGIAPKFYPEVDRFLKPLKSKVQGTEKYNHLSVRAAAAIVLDKLLGE